MTELLLPVAAPAAAITLASPSRGRPTRRGQAGRPGSAPARATQDLERLHAEPARQARAEPPPGTRSGSRPTRRSTVKRSPQQTFRYTPAFAGRLALRQRA